MTATAIEMVDRALDRYVAEMGRRGLDPAGVKAVTLAGLIDCPTPSVSSWLQEYRLSQLPGGTATRYVIGCQGYGRKARWRILAKPGSDPLVVRKARREQARWITQDVVSRYLRDRVHEVIAALQGNADDEQIRHVTKLAADQLEALAEFVEVMLGGTGGGGDGGVAA